MDYFERLESETHKLYEIANEARSKGLDVELLNCLITLSQRKQ